MPAEKTCLTAAIKFAIFMICQLWETFPGSENLFGDCLILAAQTHRPGFAVDCALVR
jgi:hypothetical protein